MKPAPAPLPPTPLIGAAPLATPPHGGPPDLGRRWRARHRMGTMVPLDGEDFAPHPAVLIIGHAADRHGSARQEQHGGAEKEEPRRGAGEGAGAVVAPGLGRRRDVPPPPHPCHGAAILVEGVRELHWK